ncbi:CDP-diacylglycerol--glycerol-3-phosphate 3-phosphatidyltransferase 1, chloroplastic [Linum grandiflorum]
MPITLYQYYRKCLIKKILDCGVNTQISLFIAFPTKILMKKFPHHCFEIASPPPTTAMPALKLSMSVASFSSKPYKWPRSFLFPPSSPPSSSSAVAVAAVHLRHPSPFSSSASAAAEPVVSVDSGSRRAWRRIPTCAHHRAPYHFFSCSSNNNDNSKNKFSSLLGRPSSRFSFSSSRGNNSGSSSSAAPKSSGFSGSDSSASGGVIAEEDMGSDNKLVDGVNGLVQPHQKQHCSTKLLTLPTILTLGRVAAVPLLIANLGIDRIPKPDGLTLSVHSPAFYVDSWLGRTATTNIFIAAAITDWLDGYLARKMKLGSAFGAFLDPVADKLMVAATLVILCTKPLEIPMLGPVSWLLTVPSIAIIGREITMSAVREWAASQDSKLLEAVAVNNLGKWKTATQMTALTILLATRDGGAGGPAALVASGVVLLYISAGLSVYSLAVYMSKIWKVLLK